MITPKGRRRREGEKEREERKSDRTTLSYLANPLGLLDSNHLIKMQDNDEGSGDYPNPAS